MTDGIENRARYIADVAPQINEATYALGLGTPQNTSAAALQTISGNNGGFLLITGAIGTDNRFLLQKYFLQILAGVSNADVVLDPEGELSPGRVHRIPFQLTARRCGRRRDPADAVHADRRFPRSNTERLDHRTLACHFRAWNAIRAVNGCELLPAGAAHRAASRPIRPGRHLAGAADARQTASRADAGHRGRRGPWHSPPNRRSAEPWPAVSSSSRRRRTSRTAGRARVAASRRPFKRGDRPSRPGRRAAYGSIQHHRPHLLEHFAEGTRGAIELRAGRGRLSVGQPRTVRISHATWQPGLGRGQTPRRNWHDSASWRSRTKAASRQRLSRRSRARTISVSGPAASRNEAKPSLASVPLPQRSGAGAIATPTPIAEGA